jgi:hypothetical protein
MKSRLELRLSVHLWETLGDEIGDEEKGKARYLRSVHRANSDILGEGRQG